MSGDDDGDEMTPDERRAQDAQWDADERQAREAEALAELPEKRAVSFTLDLYCHANGAGLAAGPSVHFTEANDLLRHLEHQTATWQAAGYRVCWRGVGFIVADDSAGIVRAVAVTRSPALHYRAAASLVGATAADPNPGAIEALRTQTRKDQT